MSGREPRQRVLQAINHQVPDLIPYNFSYTPPMKQRLERHYQTPDLHRAMGLHLYLATPGGKPLYASPDLYGGTISDQFGVLWTTSNEDRGVPIDHVLDEPSLHGYHFPDPRESRRFLRMAESLAREEAYFRVAVIGDLWERAYFMRGIENLLVDVRWNRSFVEGLLDALADYVIETLKIVAGYSIDAVFISDDYGFQDRLMIDPRDWRQLVKPRLSRILGIAKTRNLYTMLHSCGKVDEVVPDLVDIGLDVLHPVQAEAMDALALKRRFGRSLTLWGCIGTQGTLVRGSPQEVKREVEQLIDTVGDGGGLILEPMTLQSDVPLENILAVIEAINESSGI